ncbi:MAG TPA: hypothetical protein VG206_27165 [Terriglobia bacterium]|nr:hypothetical protein [Terriglobia bacterium]
MLSTRLVKMIEHHADDLTRSVVGDLQENPKTPTYGKLSTEDLYQRVHEVFRDFGQWLEYKPDETMERWYGELGKKRYAEGIHLAEVVYALTLTQYHLQDYIRSAGLVDSAMELYQEMELRRLVNRFFNKAVYYCVKGYMQQVSVRPEASRSESATASGDRKR